MDIYLGQKLGTGETWKIQIPRNQTTTPNRNYLMISTQGSGKTSLIMLFANMLYRRYKETKNQYGAIPIIFAPTFEFMQFEQPSKHVNLPPDIHPEGVPSINVTFPICEPIKRDNLRIHSFDFTQMDEAMILGFTDCADDDKTLGAVKKCIEKIKFGYYRKQRNDEGKLFDAWIAGQTLTLDVFIEMVREDKSLYDALYYVFVELKEQGMFDTKRYPQLSMRELILEKKPILIHFGDLDDRQRMSGIAGMIFKQLWDISNIFYNAGLKAQENQPLDEFERFLLKNWTIALFMEEAHQILYATKSSGLSLESKHPAHYWFKKITALMGRKRGFKYSFIVTQKFMEIFYGIRTTFDELVIGQTIYPDDKQFLESDLKMEEEHINSMTRLPKYCWTFLDIDRYQKRQKKCACKVKVFLSPCGQPK